MIAKWIELRDKVLAAWNQIKEVFQAVAEPIVSIFGTQNGKEVIKKQQFINTEHTRGKMIQSQVLMNKPKYIQARSRL